MSFALAWTLLSFVDARGYRTQTLQPTVALQEEARQAAATALALDPNLGETLHAEECYYYACLKDYAIAGRYFEQARPLLPNSNRIPESLAYLKRRRGYWDRRETYFNETERLAGRKFEKFLHRAEAAQSAILTENQLSGILAA